MKPLNTGGPAFPLEEEADAVSEKTTDFAYRERNLETGLHIKRTGKCQPEKCGSACCKFHLNRAKGHTDTYDYHSFFADEFDKQGNFVYNKNCEQLDEKNNKCKLWGSEKFPEVCKQFPSVNDPVYRHVRDKCTFKFIIAEDERIVSNNNPLEGKEVSHD